MSEFLGMWPELPLVAVLIGTLMVMAISERHLAERVVRRRPRSYARSWRPRIVPASPPSGYDHAEQLRVVERAVFSPRPLLNRSEARLFETVERACAQEAPGWRVMAQVCLGEILASPDEQAFRAINAKRVDLLIVDRAGLPLHAIEYQGSGHHLGPAATRDAIKKEALRRAGVGYIEVCQEDTPADVTAHIAKLAARSAA